MRLRFWLSIDLLALVLSACGPTPLPLANAERDAAFEITVYQGADVLGGQSVRFSEVFAQGKPVVLNTWAGPCPICRNEMPEL